MAGRDSAEKAPYVMGTRKQSEKGSGEEGDKSFQVMFPITLSTHQISCAIPII